MNSISINPISFTSSKNLTPLEKIAKLSKILVKKEAKLKDRQSYLRQLKRDINAYEADILVEERGKKHATTPMERELFANAIASLSCYIDRLNNRLDNCKKTIANIRNEIDKIKQDILENKLMTKLDEQEARKLGLEYLEREENLAQEAKTTSDIKNERWLSWQNSYNEYEYGEWWRKHI